MAARLGIQAIKWGGRGLLKHKTKAPANAGAFVFAYKKKIRFQSTGASAPGDPADAENY